MKNIISKGFHLLNSTLCILLMTAKLVYGGELVKEDLHAALKTRVTEENKGVGLVVGLINRQQQHVYVVGKSRKQGGVLTENSLFEIGSISKTFTGLLLANMVLSEEVKLDDPVAKFLPYRVTMPVYNGKQISLLHLATHTSGLPRLPDNLSPRNMPNPYFHYQVKDLYEFLSNYKLNRAIGEKVEYSNLGLGLLGHVLALKAGKSYEDLLRERVLNVLSMNDTVIKLSQKHKVLMTTGYDATGTATSHWDLPALAGAGALRSSGKDMMTYLKANMGLIQTPLSAAIEMTHQLQRMMDTENNGIGLGWFMFSGPDGEEINHEGGTGGYRSLIRFNKNKAKGVFVLANSHDDVNEIAHAIMLNQIEKIKVKKHQVINVDRELLLAYVGKYELAPGFILAVTEQEGNLYVQATGQDKFPVYAKSNKEFFYKVVKASITFNRDKSGKVESLILHQGGDHTGERIDE